MKQLLPHLRARPGLLGITGLRQNENGLPKSYTTYSPISIRVKYFWVGLLLVDLFSGFDLRKAVNVN